jgi:hypothetical protein
MHLSVKYAQNSEVQVAYLNGRLLYMNNIHMYAYYIYIILVHTLKYTPMSL